MVKAKKKKNYVPATVFLFICVILSIVLGMKIEHKLSNKFQNVSECVMIPDSKMVSDFCKENGYEYGYVSSSLCDVNEVICHKSVGRANYDDCLKWVKSDG